ncbi:hypothetical protein CMUST_12190 [Corynebacterium mustelae]|uniref:DUF1542 domain-containing protein n=1 Tax=Corynebacterium mustelae TaxID=571915 RepID=A0A0G3H6L0_9CORY|nr:hypothetical protein [Corynebacterium mustelae]AKK06747.1 hypothetical protein CMUST_12190 [Corynebacterium mustelae]
MTGLILIAVVIGGVVLLLSRSGNKKAIASHNTQLDDAIADARRWIERLGSQVLSISGTDAASTQAIADASERYNAASSQISTAQTVRQAQLARESALEGLYFMNAAREIMGLPAGPELPPLEGQKTAGKVSEHRTITHDGHEIIASPAASAQTPHYYPGGAVAGRPVPAGWYSEPWWASALRTGVWAASSAVLFSALFGGMAGVASASAFESGIATGDLPADDPTGGAFDSGGADVAEGAGESGGLFDGFFDGGFLGGNDGGGFFGGGDSGGFFGGGDGGGFDF